MAIHERGATLSKSTCCCLTEIAFHGAFDNSTWSGHHIAKVLASRLSRTKYLHRRRSISSIIDWQGTWTTPAFVGASPPLLLDYGVDFLMKLPDNFKSLDEPEKNKLRNRVSQSILIHSYETKTAKHNPLMNKVMRLPHGRTLKLLEAFTGSTWDNCLYPLEDCLIKIEK